MNAELVARLLDRFSAEDGLNYNTGNRLTMKPMARNALPRAVSVGKPGAATKPARAKRTKAEG